MQKYVKLLTSKVKNKNPKWIEKLSIVCLRDILYVSVCVYNYLYIVVTFNFCPLSASSLLCLSAITQDIFKYT